MIRVLKLLLMIVCLIYSTAWAGDTLFIHCLDVGQGDATLIVSPTGQTMLVDAGNNGMGEDKVLPLLDNLNITSLDYIIATHYHADHVGGIDEVVDSLSIDSIGVIYDRGGLIAPIPTTIMLMQLLQSKLPLRTAKLLTLAGGLRSPVWL